MWVVQNTHELQAPMLSGSEDDPAPRRPFEFITNIFKRRRDHEGEDDARPPDINLHEAEETGSNWTEETVVLARHDISEQEMTSSSEALASPGIMTSSEMATSSSVEGGASVSGLVHHTPVKNRDIGIDMEAIRLSRQDNPYLQRVFDSHTTLNEEETTQCVSGSQPEDRAQLVTQVSQEGVLSLSEVHEHLIRSPPPTSVPKTLPKNVFVFPVTKALDGASTQQPEGATTVKSGSLKPLVTRQHEDVLDHHLRQILHTQRQLVVTRGRPGEGSSNTSTSTSMPGSPAHARNLARRSPHARTLSEEATVVQSVGGSSGQGVGGGAAAVPGTSTSGAMGVSLAPVLPPGRKQHSSSDLLLNPANPPTCSATPTPTPPVLKPISSKTKRSTGGPEPGLASSSLRLPIRYPHQPAASSPLIDIT
ncbi:uncharacterized protein LOC121855474 isoform X2 [Homarus americanus]|uniref:uncharacterized protein LOC121855474 isoform X2 n=1 Tax=Homarus americanus TaxID=6706 RepID=UPI001C436DF6|nr:uncharacterized protein LOC121855474 isoform X2 [Homarus americanus]XP_042206368.1 uncharacterized protein LOC121855474 isoform X2 [Homarus americanus]XP_042206370.1 uncharacterized protein LOC121855474 isoform X2 [Homarus americanus]XP_042206371.1 uncharacterized protein LOC121855474 isoform X2 [Homarus americanus]